MGKILSDVTDRMNFFEGKDPVGLAETYGTPLYVYNERILRTPLPGVKAVCLLPQI